MIERIVEEEFEKPIFVDRTVEVPYEREYIV